jgi:hypothetical protein
MSASSDRARRPRSATEVAAAIGGLPGGRGRIRDNVAVTTAIPGAARRQGALLLADISGYTGFLQGVADAHRDIIIEADEPPPAYAVLSHLLDTMVGLPRSAGSGGLPVDLHLQRLFAHGRPRSQVHPPSRHLCRPADRRS